MFNFSIKYDDLIWGDKFKDIEKTKFLKIDDAFSFIKINSSDVNIVTHNGDIPVDEKFVNYSHKFPKWYGQNVTCKSMKFNPIPIGLENDYVPNAINKKQTILSLSNEKCYVEPSKLLYINHNIGTNPIERQKPYGIFATSDWCTVEHSGGYIYQDNYYAKMLNHAFMLSPPGNGIDCHRTWEILYLKRIPILKRSGRLEDLYSDLPVLFINEYDEISESFLSLKINEMKNKSYNFEKLKFGYWRQEVQK
jgi:hypothetical protein